MPNLLITAPPTLPLPAILLPVAANPVGIVGAEESGGFAALIAEIRGEAMMLDAPSAPVISGTALPLERPNVAGPPEPLPDVEVEDVMVGRDWPPADLAIKAPAISPSQIAVQPAPAPEAPEVPRVEPSSPLVPSMLHTSSALVLARVAPDLPAPIAGHLPAPAEDEAESPQSRDFQKPAEDAKIQDQPLPVLATAPAPLSQPTAASPLQSAPTRARPVEQTEESEHTAHPVVILPQRNAAGPKRALDLPLPPQVATQPSDVPDGVATFPELETSGSSQAPVAAKPAATPATPRAETSIPPELARQVAQLIRPAQAETPPPPPAAAAVEPAPSNTAHVAPATPATATPPVFQPVHAAPVDMARAEWMQAMIDRIGDIAQAESRRDVQIRLLPDALGPVEVKIVQRDERMHVTLNADHAQTRQLLSDAAPRLQELAEARGLRFAQTDVGGGQSQQDRRPASEQPPTPLRPRSVSERDAEPQPDGDLIA